MSKKKSKDKSEQSFKAAQSIGDYLKATGQFEIIEEAQEKAREKDANKNNT